MNHDHCTNITTAEEKTEKETLRETLAIVNHAQCGLIEVWEHVPESVQGALSHWNK